MPKNLIIPLASIVLGACLHTPTTQTTPTPESQPSTTTSITSPDGNTEVVNYTINLKNFSFSPALIEAEPGETIRVKLTNSQGTHNFVIDELGVQSTLLSQGDESIIEIVVPQSIPSGTQYELYCGVGNHRSLGMVGVFRVK